MKRLALVLTVVVSLAIIGVLIGCNRWDYEPGIPTSDFPVVGDISGQVFRPASATISIRGSFFDSIAIKIGSITDESTIGVPGAIVWLEEVSSIPAVTTDANGRFQLQGVPVGSWHVITNYHSPSGVTWKIRIDNPVEVGSNQIQEQTTFLRPAVNRVRGRVLDYLGHPFPAGSTVLVWGEAFTTQAGGQFETPLLPDDVVLAYLIFPDTALSLGQRVPISFCKGAGTPWYEFQFSHRSIENRMPTLLLYTFVSDELTRIVQTRERLNLIAIITDPDVDDTLPGVSWFASRGELSVAPDHRSASFLAPEWGGPATISVEVEDIGGAREQVCLPIEVIGTLSSDTRLLGCHLLKSENPGLIDDVHAVIDHAQLYAQVTIPFGTDRSRMRVRFHVHETSRLLANSTVLTTGLNEIDVSKPLPIEVIAADKTKSTYMLAVQYGPDISARELLRFDLEAQNNQSELVIDVTGLIDHDQRSVSLAVESETVLSTLAATFAISPLATLWHNGVKIEGDRFVGDFRLPLSLNVISADGGIATYVASATIIVDPSPPKISSMTQIAPLTNSAVGVLDVRFSKTVVDFGSEDLTLVLDGQHIAVPDSILSGSRKSYQFDLTTLTGADGQYRLVIYRLGIHDRFGMTPDEDLVLEWRKNSNRVIASLEARGSNPTNKVPISVLVSFSSPVTEFGLEDVSVENGTAVALRGSQPGSEFELDVMPVSSGTVTIGLPADCIVDLAGNRNPAAGPLEIIFDTECPTVTLTSVASDVTNVIPIPLIIEFSKQVDGFTIANLTVSNAALSGFHEIRDGQSWAVALHPQAQGEVLVEIASGIVQDAAGNGNLPSARWTRVLDTIAPRLVTVNFSASDPTNIGMIPVEIEFSEQLPGFSLADLQVTNGVADDMRELLPGQRFGFNVTAGAAGSVTVAIPDQRIADFAGNWCPSTTVLGSTFDDDAPVLTLSCLAPPTTGIATIPIRIESSETVTGLDVSDLLLSNAVATNWQEVISGLAWTLDIVASTDGPVSIEIPAGIAIDAAGNTNAVVEPLQRVYDGVRPSLSVVLPSAGQPPDPTPMSVIHFEIKFSEIVEPLQASHLVVTNGELSAWQILEPGRHYTFELTVASEGIVTLDLPSSSVVDAAGNGNQACTLLSVGFDPAAPVLTLSSSASGTTNLAAIPFRVESSEQVSGFDAGKITVTNGIITDFQTENPGRAWTAAVQPAAEGMVKVAIAADAATDAAGNTSAAVPAIERIQDRTAPTVTLNSIASNPTQVTPIAVTVTFSEPVTGLAPSDFLIANGVAAGISDVTAGTVYLVQVTPSTAGEVTVNLPANTVVDAGDNGNIAAAPWSISFDDRIPTIVAVGSTRADGWASCAAIIDVETRWSKTVRVTGNPRLLLETGITDRYAEYLSGDNTDTITFRYLTQMGDYNADLDYVSADSLELNGGMIRDEAHNNANLTLPVPGTAGSISYWKNIKVDGVPPSVQSINRQTPTTTVVRGGDLVWRVIFNDAIDPGSLSTASFVLTDTGNVATTNIDSIAQLDIQTWDVTVSMGLIGNGDLRLDLPAGSVRDIAGNPSVDHYTGGQIFTIDRCPTYYAQIGRRTSDDGGFAQPCDLALDADGNLLVTDVSNDRVQKFDANGNYLSQFGRPGIDNGKFSAPRGMVVSTSGHIFVADQNNHRVQKFDSSGTFVSKFGSMGAGDGKFINPCGIAMSGAGQLFVADTGNNRIQRFDQDGNYLGKFGTYGPGDGQLDFPCALAFDHDGYLLVVEGGANQRVQRFDVDGTPLGKFGGVGAGDGQFNAPWGIAVDSTGAIYVADGGNDRIQKFTSAGAFVVSWGGTGVTPGLFNSPAGIAINALDEVYVADRNNLRIQRFTTAGVFVAEWGTGNPTAPGTLNLPKMMRVDAAGNIYVADSANHRVQKFSSSGAFLLQIGTNGTADGQFNTPYGIAVDHLGNIIVADTSNHRMQKFDASGNWVWTVGGTGSGAGDGQFNLPRDVAVDSIGNVYVSDQGNHRVQKFSPGGAFMLKWGTNGTGDGQFETPTGIAIDHLDRVFVADRSAGTRRVQRFDADGNYQIQFGGSGAGDGQFNTPWGVTADHLGYVYVADAGLDRIQKFTADGEFVAKWGSLGTGDGLFGNPNGVAVDPGGVQVVVGDESNVLQLFR